MGKTGKHLFQAVLAVLILGTGRDRPGRSDDEQTRIGQEKTGGGAPGRNDRQGGPGGQCRHGPGAGRGQAGQGNQPGAPGQRQSRPKFPPVWSTAGSSTGATSSLASIRRTTNWPWPRPWPGSGTRKARSNWPGKSRKCPRKNGGVHRSSTKKIPPLVAKEPQLAAARAKLEAERAELRRAQLNLEKNKGHWPLFDGVVSSKSVDIGQYVSPGQTVAALFSSEAAEVVTPLEDKDLYWIDVPGLTTETGPGSPAVVRAFFAGRNLSWPARGGPGPG